MYLIVWGRSTVKQRKSNARKFTIQKMKPGQSTTRTVNYELEKITFIVWQVFWNRSNYEMQYNKNLMKMGYMFLTNSSIPTVYFHLKLIFQLTHSE